MRIPYAFLCLMVLASPAARAAEALDHAWRAQALLGPGVWSQVIRIENEARNNRYPRTVHALVFELAGLLWFYADTNGTQSFSLHRGRLAAEKADYAPLLRDIEPGFIRWSVVEGTPTAAALASPALPNGCFVESVAALRARLAQNQGMRNPRLLSYYIDGPGGQNGHTVLAYESLHAVEIVDPGQPERIFRLPLGQANDALALARGIDGAVVARARLLPVTMPAPPAMALSGPRLPGEPELPL